MDLEKLKSIINIYEGLYWDTLKKYHDARFEIERLTKIIEERDKEYMCYDCVIHRELQPEDRYEFYRCPDKKCCCYKEQTIREFFKSKH